MTEADQRAIEEHHATAAVRRAFWRPTSLSTSRSNTETVEISAALLQRLTCTLYHAA